MGVSTRLTLVLLIFRFLKRSWTNWIPNRNPCLLLSFQWLVRCVSGAYHLGLWAFTCPEFYGRKVLLLFLTIRSCLLHRKTHRHCFFSSILDTLALHILVCLFHLLSNECCLIADILKVFSIHTSLSYSYLFVTLEGNTFKEVRLMLSLAGIREARY